MTLDDYLKERGRTSQLARDIGAPPQLICQWTSEVASQRRRVPIERCVDIERATGAAVRRWDLRPDDWHRIWPELITADGAPPVPQASEQGA